MATTNKPDTTSAEITPTTADGPTRASDPAVEPATPTTPETASSGQHRPQNEAVQPVPGRSGKRAEDGGTARPWTPDRNNADGSTTITTKRACNGCGELLGDITDQEMSLAIAGASLPDVRRECPTCGPTAPEPVCRPVRIVAGDALCLDLECDHELTTGEYCDEVAEEVICGTHSEITNVGEIVHAEPWPCKHSKSVTA